EAGLGDQLARERVVERRVFEGRHAPASAAMPRAAAMALLRESDTTAFLASLGLPNLSVSGVGSGWYIMLRRSGTKPASLMCRSISGIEVGCEQPALLTTFSSSIAEPKSSAPM